MRKAKILIAEDDAITSMDLYHTFRRWGYQLCRQVSTAEEAINNAEQDRPDVVVMDINLNGKINGITAAAQIHSRFGIPIVFVSGYSDLDSEIKKKTEIAEPAGYFNKPLDLNKIRLTIDSLTLKGE